MMETEEGEGEGLTLDNKRVHNNTHPAVTEEEEEGDGGVRVDVDPGSEEEEEAEDYPGQEEEEVEGEEEEGEAGKGRIYVTSNGRNVNRDGCSKPALLLQDGNDTIVLDLVSAPEEEAEGRKCLFQEERLARDSRVSSDVDHGAGGDLLLLNGFTESPEEEERRIMASLEGGEGGKGEDGVAGTAKEAGMAPPPAVPSSDMDHSVLWSGEDGNDGGDGDRDSPCADGVGTESVTSLVHAQLPCEQGKHPERNCAGGGVESLPVSDMTLPNGDVDDLRYSVGPGGDMSPCKQHRDVLLSDPRTNSESEPVVVGGLCDTDGKEIIQLANGGLHLPNVADSTRDHPSSSDSDSEEYFSQNKTNVPFDVVCVVQRDSNRQPDRESPEESVPAGTVGSAAGSCVNSQGGGDKNNHRGESNSAEPPAGEEEETVQPTQLSLPPSSLVEEQALDPSSKEGPPTPDDLSAKPPSSCPSASTLSNLTSDSHGTEPSPREEEGDEEEEEEVEEDSGEGSADFSLPSRPQTLRTNLPSVTVSLSCDATPLSPEEGGGEGGFYFGGEEGFEPGGRRQSAPDNLAEQNDASEHKLMPKRFGIADFFTRSLFTRKAKEPKVPPCQNATGWRLFGKTSKEDPPSPTAQQEDQLKGSSELPCSQRPPVAAGKRRNLEFEPLSTTALILEDRPPNLPAKCLEEAQRHKQEYEEMVAGAKRREMKEAQKKKRQMKERYRQEESIAHAIHIWNNEILPHWDSVKGSRRVRDLWWNGLPPSVRGRVWSLAIANELNITPELYEIFLSRAKEKCRSYSETSSVNDSESEGASLADRESSLDLIKLDISRTFPSLFIFQKGGPYHDLLHSILGAYTCYRPDIGYVQGMSFIAAVLILNLEEAEAFITFANLLNKPCQMAFFRVDHELMLKYFAAFEVFFEENLPHLFNHFQTNSLTPDLYLIDWIFTLYSKSLPLDVACRVWDVFCRDGEESLFRTGLGILRLYEEVLLQMDFIHIAQFLSRLPEDLASDTLFTAMANTHMVSGNRRWGQVFSALMKDANKEMDKSHYSPALRS